MHIIFFLSYVGVRVHRENVNTISRMDVLVLINRQYICKLLTFADRISDRHAQVWCEVVKKEDYEELAKRRLEENPNLKKLTDSVSGDVFMKEQQRLRVDVKGNSFIEIATPKTSLLITFIPVADGNHTFPILSKTLGMGGPAYTTITYWMDSMTKRSLSTVSFDPWIMSLSKRRQIIRIDRKIQQSVKMPETTKIENIPVTENPPANMAENIHAQRTEYTPSQMAENTRVPMTEDLPTMRESTPAQFAISESKSWYSM